MESRVSDLISQSRSPFCNYEQKKKSIASHSIHTASHKTNEITEQPIDYQMKFPSFLALRASEEPFCRIEF